jgi:hypothetical protein
MLGLVKSSIHDFKEEEKKEFQKSLVAWFRENQRDLPWRKQLSIPDVDQRAYAGKCVLNYVNLL